MSILGKLHEFSFYGLVTALICLIKKWVSISALRNAAICVSGFTDLFLCYLFWAAILFIPIAVIGAFSTKYRDNGEGLLFNSENAFVIAFAHIAEETLGLVCTPFWFFKGRFHSQLKYPQGC